jgi:branched-chain amino acid transport system permease protein
MGEILQYVLSGLSLGGIYALVAIGFYIMWEATKTANFTHGDVYMFGAVLAVVFVGQGLPLVLAAILAVAAATITGLLVERVFVRPFNKEVNATAWMLTTIAVGIMIESGVTITYGPLGRPLPSPLAERPVRFGGAGIYPQELLLPVATIVVMVALEAFYRRTILGRAMRAVAFNRTVAGLMGINVNRISLVAYGMAAGIAAIAGILIAPVAQATPHMGTLVGLKAFGVAMVAGTSNARGVVVVGIGYGILEKFIEGYLSTGTRNAIGFTLMILILLVCPQGIFGRRELVKV